MWFFLFDSQEYKSVFIRENPFHRGSFFTTKNINKKPIFFFRVATRYKG
jgi:hypothetical protein